jgi:hypothetical protein
MEVGWENSGNKVLYLDKQRLLINIKMDGVIYG